MTYLNAKKYIISSPKQSTKNDFDVLLETLGNPHKRIKYIRLVGNNGKTLCAEMLTSTLLYAGYTVGCLKMPPREEPRENICIGSECLSMEQFTEYTQQIKCIVSESGITPSQSEILLAIALLAFKEAKCNLCVIESDHDSQDPSKQLPAPFAAVICGTIPSNDTEQISKMRSYICKGIEEIVSVPQNSEAYKIISDTCYSINCRLTLPNKNAITPKKLSFRKTEFSYKGVDYALNLCGKFQIYNAVLVIETLEMLSRKGFSITNDAINRGLSNLKIPAKFEIISLSPVIIVDSTHTPTAIETVCDSLADFKEQTGTSIRLCLPSGKIVTDYISVLESKGYTIESVCTIGTMELPSNYVLSVCSTEKALVKKALSELDKGALLLFSGSHEFVVPIRRKLLEILGF